MSNSYSIALVNCSQYVEELVEHHPNTIQVKSLKDLVRLLIDRELDLVILPDDFSEESKIEKIYNQFKTPFLIEGHSSDRICFLSDQDKKGVLHAIAHNHKHIHSHKVERQNERLSFCMSNLADYSNQVIHATKDMFIAETKNYFKKNFELKSCHWAEVKNTSVKLPPILRLKTELENQKVDQNSLLADIDSCTSELTNTGDFQIWKTTKGLYMLYLWIADGEDKSQCLILNQVKLRSRYEAEEFLRFYMPILTRRWQLTQTVASAQTQIYKDSLTDLYNQKFLNEVVEKKIEEYRRYKTPFSVLFIDVDHFKKVNDSMGHVVGSGVLTLLGGLLKGQIRTSDFAFRYGGDEFIVLLSHTEGTDAEVVAERIRKSIEDNKFVLNETCVRITVSIGLAFYPVHAQSAEEIIRIADEAMYYGKNKSRNIVYKAN